MDSSNTTAPDYDLKMLDSFDFLTFLCYNKSRRLMPTNESLQALALVPASEPRCHICNHPERKAIEEAMLTPGRSLRSVARDYGLILSNVQNHRPHMGAALQAAQALREVESVGELYKRIATTAAEIAEAARKALAANQMQAAAALWAEYRKYHETLAKFAQTPGFREAVPGGTVHVNAPEARIVLTHKD